MTFHLRAKVTAILLPLAALLCLASFAPAQAVKDLPAPTDYVSDFAHVLSPEAVARLDSICSQLDHSAAKAKVAVVTVKTLDGDDAADYADDLEDHWKMGDKGDNRYAMVLLAVNDRKYRIEVGYGLEGILTDGDVGDIGRAMVPYLRSNDYDSAVTLAVGEVAETIARDAHVTLNLNAPVPQPVEQAQPQRSSGGLGQLLLLIFVLLFFGGGSLLRMLFGWGLFFGGWGGGGPWIGGGWGGGGSGGGGFGGDGFSGFGGAGGGFGGGGAGGSW